MSLSFLPPAIMADIKRIQEEMTAFAKEYNQKVDEGIVFGKLPEIYTEEDIVVQLLRNYLMVNPVEYDTKSYIVVAKTILDNIEPLEDENAREHVVAALLEKFANFIS